MKRVCSSCSSHISRLETYIGRAAAKSAHSAREWPQCALPEALERGQLRSLLKVAKRGSEVDCEEISYNIISLPFVKLFLFHAQD